MKKLALALLLAAGCNHRSGSEPAGDARTDGAGPDEPRTMRRTVMVGGGQTAIADITVYFPIPSNVKMPYGTPPMRCRVV